MNLGQKTQSQSPVNGCLYICSEGKSKLVANDSREGDGGVFGPTNHIVAEFEQHGLVSATLEIPPYVETGSAPHTKNAR